MAVVKLPEWTDKIPNKDEMYADFWLGTTLVKMQEYNKRSEVYSTRYRMSFKQFEKRVLSAKKENLREWDDYIVWKGIEEAHTIWASRYKEFCKCEV